MRTVRRTRGRAQALTLAGLLVVGAAGCSSEDLAEGVIDRAADAAGADVDVDEDEGRVSVNTGDGEGFSVQSTDEIPTEVTDLVPIPDGFVAEGVTETQMGEDGEGTMVSGTIATDDPGAVLDEIEAALVDRGFETQNNADIGGEIFNLMMVKPDEASVTVNIIVGDDGEPAEMNIMVLHGTS